MLSLVEQQYAEESITAADNVIDVICQSIKNYKKLPSMNRNDIYKVLSKELDLRGYYIRVLEDLYQLRCCFSSHPAISNWWDFFEIYSDKIDVILQVVKIVVIKFIKYEEKNRVIEKYRIYWSRWFIDNCDVIYDSISYHRLPILNR